MSYHPSPEILKKYADLLVKYALNSGGGVKQGEVVQVVVPECAKPMYVPLRTSILEAGAIPFMQYLPDDVDMAGYYSQATDDQLTYFMEKYYRGVVDQVDHSINIIAEADKHELESVDPQKLIARSVAMKPYRDWREAKENDGMFTWTLALYGTPAMAAEVGMSEEAYWDQIISACYLDSQDPVAKWREVSENLEATRKWLNSLQIEKVHVEAEDVDLWVKLGSDRQWLGGSGRNIPSFELFISPDWRGTEGSISFNQPLYYMGKLIEGVKLRFEKGLVVESSATRNEELLKEMIAAKNADKVGEFSLTDGRLSHITKLMGETLYDENRGGEQGNTHVALGNAYKDSFVGNPSKLSEEDWADRGSNESVIHTDIISTSKRKVTAYLPDGSQTVIYENGKFTNS
jgi:aminopeptidase